MKTLKVEAFESDEAYYSWLEAREAGLRVSKYTPIIVPEDDCTTAHIIVKCKRLDTAIKHAKEAFADYSDVVEALEELERKRAEDKHVTGISDRYNTISTCYNGIDGEYSFYIVVEARDEVAEASEESNPEETETQTETNTNGGNSQDSNKAYCPALGGWIMHYDACRGGCEYDSETDTCKLYRNNTRKGGDA